MLKICLLFSLFLFSSIAFSDDSNPIEKLINSERVQRQLAPLSFNEKLQCASKIHALDIGKSGLCTHFGKDRSNAKQRLKRCKYDLIQGEELLACGFAAPEDAFKALMDSPKQKQIIIDPRYTHMGCSENKNYYVCVLAR